MTWPDLTPEMTVEEVLAAYDFLPRHSTLIRALLPDSRVIKVMEPERFEVGDVVRVLESGETLLVRGRTTAGSLRARRGVGMVPPSSAKTGTEVVIVGRVQSEQGER